MEGGRTTAAFTGGAVYMVSGLMVRRFRFGGWVDWGRFGPLCEGPPEPAWSAGPASGVPKMGAATAGGVEEEGSGWGAGSAAGPGDETAGKPPPPGSVRYQSRYFHWAK